MLRVVFAGLLGYALIGLLIFAADRFIPRGPYYYPVVLATDTLFTFTGGWLCGRIARGDMRAAWGVILMGELMGLASTIYLWDSAPHYYSIYLLVMYPPAIWFGAKPGAQSFPPGRRATMNRGPVPDVAVPRDAAE